MLITRWSTKIILTWYIQIMYSINIDILIIQFAIVVVLFTLIDEIVTILGLS